MSFLQIPIGTYPNTFLGYQSSISITTGVDNTAFGNRALNANTSGNWNSAFGNWALEFNQTGTDNSAFGDRALRVSRGSKNSGFGSNVMLSLFTGLDNSAFGVNALYRLVSGNKNTAFGTNALSFPFGSESENSAFGYGSLDGLNGGNRNSAFGYQSGIAITSGSKNSILGSYSGNQGGLDIRTLSNYIVLSDGDGNPRLWIDNTGAVNIPGGTALPGGVANGVLYLNGSKVVTSGSALTFNGSIFSAPFVQSSDANASVKADGNGVGGIRMYANSSGTTILETTTDSDLIFRRNSIEGMRLTSTGLGIGTTNPQRKLHVVSNGPLRMGQASDYFDFSQSSTNLWSWISNSSVICLQMNGATGAVVIGGALSTAATDGFLYVSTCAGTPTGTPTTYTGRAPIVIDTTNNKLYFYSGGAWRDAGP